jgi:probable F420-dependent oxidoreductase
MPTPSGASPSFSIIVPNFGPFGDAEILLRIIRAAEDLGYGGVWFADHIVIPDYAKHISSPNFWESLSLSAYGLGATQRVRFGTDVMVLPYRNPLVLAKMAATLDRLSGGRLMLGIGVGFLRGEFEALGVPHQRRGDITDEYLRVLRTLWESEGPVSFEGEFVRFRDVHFQPRPAAGIPIFVGGNAPRAHRRAAEFGDGWHPLWPPPEQYASAREAILARRAELGRTGPFTFSYSCPLTRVLDAPPPPVDSGPPPEETKASMEDLRAGRFLPEDYDFSPPGPLTEDRRLLFFGTAEQISGDIEGLRAAGVDRFALRFSVGSGEIDLDGFVAQMERFAREVAPAAT